MSKVVAKPVSMKFELQLTSKSMSTLTLLSQARVLSVAVVELAATGEAEETMT